MLKETPLCSAHKALGAKMVEFGGWNMPVQYTNVIDEHNTTRSKAGLFDICHMGEFIISGIDAKSFLQRICLNDVEKLIPGKAQYSMLCNENGGVVDDIFIYMLKENEFMMVTNAGTFDKDHEWMLNHNPDGVEIKNISEKTSKLDLQGPLSEDILQKICVHDLSSLKRFFWATTTIEGVDCKVSRTGYTGEDGFEIYSDAACVERLWNKILETGKPLGLKPIGLGARDTLRLEACYSLYGHELSDSITPVEASLGWVVRDYKDFIGKEVILKQKKQGTKKINVAFEMVENAVPREHYPVQKNGATVGEVSSGSFSPSLRKGIGMAFIRTDLSEPGTEINIIIRGKPYLARIVKKPFYSR
ncbi:glycine cleavage system aminomethyltransferase GcvT [Candidatus Woesearchaeota archaeon]|nr:glycine cleavage system aminomethyltransferase GcvT [Candidatus Woesearchaeota archaeon]